MTMSGRKLMTISSLIIPFSTLLPPNLCFGILNLSRIIVVGLSLACSQLTATATDTTAATAPWLLKVHSPTILSHNYIR